MSYWTMTSIQTFLFAVGDETEHNNSLNPLCNNNACTVHCSVQCMWFVAL